MIYYTYVYRDPSRDMEPFYVGKGKGKRFRNHLKRKDHHPMTYRIQSMKDNGIEPDIEIIYAIDEDHAFLMESCLIEMFGRRDLRTGTLLNLTDGGDGISGQVFTPERNARISIANSGEGNFMFGKSHSPEARAKISASRIGKKLSPEICSKMSTSRKGKTPSPETRSKLSAATKKTMESIEYRSKLSIALRGKKHSVESRAKMSASRLAGIKLRSKLNKDIL